MRRLDPSNAIIRRPDGLLAIANGIDPTGAADLAARVLDGMPLDRPMILEANLALCPASSAGDIHIGLDSVGLPAGIGLRLAIPSGKFALRRVAEIQSKPK